MQMQLQNNKNQLSKMDLRSQLTLDHPEDSVAYASKEDMDKPKQATERLNSQVIDENGGQSIGVREKDKP